MFGIGENKLFWRKLSETKILNRIIRLANFIEDGPLCVHHFELNFTLFSHQSVKVRLITILKSVKVWNDEERALNCRLISQTSNSNTFFKIRLTSSAGHSVNSKSTSSIIFLLTSTAAVSSANAQLQNGLQSDWILVTSHCLYLWKIFFPEVPQSNVVVVAWNDKS